MMYSQAETATGADLLRVALMTGNFGYTFDGASRTLNLLIEHLRATGNEARVYSPLGEACPSPAQVPVISVPSIAIPTRPEYRLALGLPRAQRRDLLGFAPDILHLSTPDALGFAGLRFSKRWGTPVVASLHTRFETYLEHYGVRWLRPLIEQRLRSFYRQADIILVPTHALKDDFSQLGLGHKVRLWSRGVDQALFNPTHRDLTWRRSLGFDDADCVILFFGRLVREKGTSLFIETVQQLRQSGTRVKSLVVGDGPELGRLTKALPDTVFAGFLREAQLSRAIASSDILVNPSRSEAFGNVNLEAMASGVAVVAADEGNSRELIDHEKTGLLCRTHTSDGYVEAVWRLVHEPLLRRRLAEAGQRASTAYRWEVILDGVVNAYHEAMHLRAQVSIKPDAFADSLGWNPSPA